MPEYDQQLAVASDERGYSESVDRQEPEIKSLVGQIDAALMTLESQIVAHSDATGDLERSVEPVLAPAMIEPDGEMKDGGRPEPVIETELGRLLYELRNRITALSASERRRAVSVQEITARVRL